MQRHHDAVVETPFLGIGDIDGLLDLAYQAQRQIGIAAHGAMRNAQPGRLLDRAVIIVAMPSA